MSWETDGFPGWARMNSLIIRLSKSAAMAKPVRNQADVHLWRCRGCSGQLGGIILVEHAFPNATGLTRAVVAPDLPLDRAAALSEEIESEKA